MKLNHNYSVYVLECSDGSYYTGVTNDLERRLWEHETGPILNATPIQKGRLH
jgi:Predicted endonuclease containing a URI domain